MMKSICNFTGINWYFSIFPKNGDNNKQSAIAGRPRSKQRKRRRNENDLKKREVKNNEDR